jgi:hypothetical protein
MLVEDPMGKDETRKPRAFAIFADLIALSHLLFVGFVVWVEGLILLGVVLGWQWIFDPILRLSHIGLVGFVGVQDLLGRVCPLTTWEIQLREKAGQSPSRKPFIGRMVHALLMCDLDERTQRRIRLSFAVVVAVTFLVVFPKFS